MWLYCDIHIDNVITLFVVVILFVKKQPHACAKGICVRIKLSLKFRIMVEITITVPRIFVLNFPPDRNLREYQIISVITMYFQSP